MRLTHLPAFLILLQFLLTAPPARADDSTPNWPSFRGPGASGLANDANLPAHWDVAKNENIKWKTPIEGLGHGGPVVWGNRIYLVTAVSPDPQPVKTGVFGDIAPVENEKPFSWKVLCLDLESGALQWQRTATEGPAKIKRHPKSSHANSTPATDGSHIVAFFGAEGLYCFDPEGKELWHKDLGPLDAGFYRVPQAQWEFGSSPVIAEGKVIVQCDVQKNSFLAAFSIDTGKELWRTPRDEVPPPSSAPKANPPKSSATAISTSPPTTSTPETKSGPSKCPATSPSPPPSQMTT